MGIEIHITVPHNIKDPSSANVSGKFRELDDIFGEISQWFVRYGFPQSSTTWSRRDTSFHEGWCRHIPISYDAPAGFSFHFGPHVLSIHHYTRLSIFCTEPDLRQLLRHFTWRVLRLLSGERAIYSPDDYLIHDLVFEGLTFAQVEEHLLKLVPSTSSFAEFEHSSAEPKYYIDRFEDFCIETKGAA